MASIADTHITDKHLFMEIRGVVEGIIDSKSTLYKEALDDIIDIIVRGIGTKDTSEIVS